MEGVFFFFLLDNLAVEHIVPKILQMMHNCYFRPMYEQKQDKRWKGDLDNFFNFCSVIFLWKDLFNNTNEWVVLMEK
jgi:hypothetical protein